MSCFKRPAICLRDALVVLAYQFRPFFHHFPTVFVPCDDDPLHRLGVDGDFAVVVLAVQQETQVHPMGTESDALSVGSGVLLGFHRPVPMADVE